MNLFGSPTLVYWIAWQRPVFGLLLLLVSFISKASIWVMQNNDDVVGELQYVTAQIGETLGEVGLRYDMGFNEMANANPGVDPAKPLPTGIRLLIPSQYVLPHVAHQGVVINLAEYRLYYFPPGDNVVISMPVGIGRLGWNTPIGQTKIISKERDPTWRPSAKLRAEAKKNGAPIPDQFPPGYGNPLGRHVLRLGWPTYLIHGTNRRDGVGLRVSAGCIRMMPEDIEYLFEQIEVGTLVRVINEPIKLGHLNGSRYLEVHPLIDAPHHENLVTVFNKKTTGLPDFIGKKNAFIEKELKAPSGVPRKIS